MATAQSRLEDKASTSNLNDEGSRCIIECKDIVKMEILYDEQVMVPKPLEDVHVDIIKCLKEADARPVEAEDPDATECSSSFADTVSDTEKCSGLSDAEVESQFFGDDTFGTAYDAFSNAFQMRKKKLTNHWRSFIRPLMWRCKWTELRIKEIESQASRYSRELQAYDQAKHSLINQCTLEGVNTKAIPYPDQYCRKRAIKRRKRKKVEETTDIASYVSHHNLFSYLEKRKSNQDSTADDFPNAVITDQNAECSEKFGINDDQMLLEFGDGDISLEQMLWNIELAHSRIRNLKSKLDMIISKNASKFSSSENLSLLAAPCEAQTSSAPSPTFSAGNGDTMSAGTMYNTNQHNAGYDIGDLVIPGSEVSSYGEAFHIPDIIESTVGLLSSADVTFHQPQVGDSCEDIVDNVLIHTEGAPGDMNAFVTTNNQSVDKIQEPEKIEDDNSTIPPPLPTSEPKHVAKAIEDDKSTIPPQLPTSEPNPVVKTIEEDKSTIPPPLPTPEPNPVSKTMGSQHSSTLRSCLASDINFPKNKRKRGDRKAGSVGWNKKPSGESDS